MSTPQPLKVLEGVGKRLEVYADRIVVRRTDALAMLMPAGFGDQVLARFDQIERVDLCEPEKWRLSECEDRTLKLIITRRDHRTFSLTLDWDQYANAQEVRALIAEHISQAPATTSA